MTGNLYFDGMLTNVGITVLENGYSLTVKGFHTDGDLIPRTWYCSSYADVITKLQLIWPEHPGELS